MNIALFTNTYLPHVGGVARSVESFRNAYLEAGHKVLIIAPEFPEAVEDDAGVLRVPAIQNFNATDFSVALPVPTGLHASLEAFEPHVVHAQHPFLLGMTALRVARTLNCPLVFTHHTLYERYTHYVPGNDSMLRRFVIELATCYANLADRVFAPSESIRDVLLERDVQVPVDVVPTGVDLARFASGDRAVPRRQLHIPENAFVVGHMGRLAPEKNLQFLAHAVASAIAEDGESHFLVVGDGESRTDLETHFAQRGLTRQLHCTGTLEGQALVDALAAMDVFAFASTSETQGMVLTEAMAAGLPVVALDASGSREVVRDGVNGRLLPARASIEAFAEAIAALRMPDADRRKAFQEGARKTAEAFSISRCAQRALAIYSKLQVRSGADRDEREQAWDQLRARLSAELDILRSLNSAGAEAISAR
jgi:glycosyltransferase involved in cell wall biosynthesis